MEPPKTLKEHFIVVDDFFKKTFRQDSKLFVGLKTVQYADTALSSEVSPTVVGEMKSPPLKGPVLVALPAVQPLDKKRNSNFFALSPRLQFLFNGKTVGKLKLTSGLTLQNLCQLEQDMLLGSNGKITGRGKVTNLMEGLEFGGRLSINTIDSAAEDAAVFHCSYQHSDMFAAAQFQRNGLGSSNTTVDFGSKFLNLMVGAGFERQHPSHVEWESGGRQFNAMYIGGGFSGVNLSIGAKLTHVNGFWGDGRIAVLQRLRPSTTVACGYDLEIPTSRAKVSLGFSQGMFLRLPHFLCPSHQNGGNLNFSKTSSMPLVFAFKAESDGAVSCTLRTIFNNAIRVGIVAHQNVQEKSRVRVGVVLTLEEESS